MKPLILIQRTMISTPSNMRMTVKRKIDHESKRKLIKTCTTLKSCKVRWQMRQDMFSELECVHPYHDVLNAL